MNITDCTSISIPLKPGDRIMLMNDIDCFGKFVTPLSNLSDKFQATFDGQGFSISNLNISGSGDYLSLFGYGQGCTIKNVTFINLNVQSNGSRVAGVIGACSDCNITDITITTSNSSVTNVIKCADGAIGDQYGALIGLGTSLILKNIFIKNTLVNSASGQSIGTMAGLCSGCSVTNCHNLGFSTSSLMVNGNQSVGGLIGSLSGGFIEKSGVSNGIIQLNNQKGGGIVGSLFTATSLSECYVKSSVSIQGSSAVKLGGIGGELSQNNNFSLSNCYSRASVNGTDIVGGLFGNLQTNANLMISNCYYSGKITCQNSTFGGLVASLSSINCIFDKFLFYTSNSILDAFHDMNCLTNTIPAAISCTELYNFVNSSFDTVYWGGDNLRIEPNFTFGTCQCPSCLSSPTPSPSISPTPSSLTGCSVYPLVPNCSFCSPNTLIVSPSSFNISCLNINGLTWEWYFVALQNISTNLNITGNVNIVGNLTITQSSVVTFNFDGNRNSSLLNVGGCLNVSGNIVVNINSKPNASEFSLLLFQYNCSSQTSNVGSSQVKVVSNYNKNNCDSRKEKVNNQQNSLSVSLQFQFDKNCKRNIGLIVGLSVGIPVLLILVVVISILFLRAHAKNQGNKYSNKNQNNKGDNMMENKSYKEGTKWEEFKKNDTDLI